MSALRIALKAVETFFAELKQAGTQKDAVGRMLTRAELYDLLGYTGYEERDRAYFGALSWMPSHKARLRIASPMD